VQGLSLDAVEIDLRRSFTTGMGYVALSRVRTLAGLSVKGAFSKEFVKADPRVVAFYSKPYAVQRAERLAKLAAEREAARAPPPKKLKLDGGGAATAQSDTAPQAQGPAVAVGAKRPRADAGTQGVAMEAPATSYAICEDVLLD